MADGFNEDLDIARQQLAELDRVIPDVLPEASLAACEILLPAAVAMAPRDKGDLAGSARIEDGEADNLHASKVVVFDEFYGRFHEYGTVKMAANPFLRPAANQRRRDMQAAIMAVVNARIDQTLVKYRSRMSRK